MAVTNTNEWLKPFKEGIEIQLPGGNWVTLRPVALDVLMASGEIPDLLTPIASKTLWEGPPIDEQLTTEGFKLANDVSHLMQIIIPAALVYPHIHVGNESDMKEGEIMLKHIDMIDKMAIFQLALQPVNVLAKFRGKQIGDVVTLQPV